MVITNLPANVAPKFDKYPIPNIDGMYSKLLGGVLYCK